jgi:hypothetical protein
MLGLFITFSSKKTLMKRSIRKRIGALYEDINLERKSQRMYFLTKVIRRQVIMFLIIKVPNLPGIQVMVQLYIDLLLLVHMGVAKPFKLRSFNKVGLFSEMTIYCVTTFLVIYTDFCNLPVAQYNLSWFYIFFICVYVLISFVHMLRKPIRILYLKSIKYLKIAKHKTSFCWGPTYSKIRLAFCLKKGIETNVQSQI